MAIYDEQKALAQEAYQAKLKQNAQQKQAEIDRLANQNNSLLNKYNEQKPILKQEFTDNAQGAYINKLQQEKALPQALAAQGYNGGITESARIKLGTNYGNAYNSFNKDYNARLKGIDNNISDTQLAHQDLLSKTNSQYSMQDSEAYQYLQNNLSTILANEEARQLRKEESDRAYALQQQELAMRKAQTKSNEDRPRLSLEQAEKAYNYGTRTNGVMDTLKYYYGDDFGWNKSTNASTAENDDAKNLYLTKGIEAKLARGEINKQEANALIEKYGLANYLAKNNVKV